MGGGADQRRRPLCLRLLASSSAGAVAPLSETWGDLQRRPAPPIASSSLLDPSPDRRAGAPSPSQARARRGLLRELRLPLSALPAVRRSTLSLEIAPARLWRRSCLGSCKTTVFPALLRFYYPQRRTVRIDGVDIRNTDPADLRARTGCAAGPVISHRCLG